MNLLIHQEKTAHIIGVNFHFQIKRLKSPNGSLIEVTIVDYWHAKPKGQSSHSLSQFFPIFKNSSYSETAHLTFRILEFFGAF